MIGMQSPNTTSVVSAALPPAHPARVTYLLLRVEEGTVELRLDPVEARLLELLRAQSLADLVADGERLIDPGNREAVARFIAEEQR